MANFHARCAITACAGVIGGSSAWTLARLRLLPSQTNQPCMPQSHALAPVCGPQGLGATRTSPAGFTFTSPTCTQRARADRLDVIPFGGRSPSVRVPLPVPSTPARTSRLPSTTTCSACARTSSPLAAGQQGAGADTRERGGTLAIFMWLVLLLVVLALLAAAQL